MSTDQHVQTERSPKHHSPKKQQLSHSIKSSSSLHSHSPDLTPTSKLPPLKVNRRDVECIYVRGATALTVLNSAELSSILDGVRHHTSSQNAAEQASPVRGPGGPSPLLSPLRNFPSSIQNGGASLNDDTVGSPPARKGSNVPREHWTPSPTASSSTIQDFLNMTDASKFRKEYVLRIGSTSPWSRSPSAHC